MYIEVGPLHEGKCVCLDHPQAGLPLWPLKLVEANMEGTLLFAM